MTTPMRETGTKVVATNRKARRNYEILDTIEAGLVLRGSEVKSIRDGKVQIGDAFARIDGSGEIWLHNLTIAVYAYSQEHSGHDERASASSSSTATRSSGCGPGSTRSTCRSSRCPCTSRTVGPRSSWRSPRAARPTTSARPSPSATPTETCAGRWPIEIGTDDR